MNLLLKKKWTLKFGQPFLRVKPHDREGLVVLVAEDGVEVCCRWPGTVEGRCLYDSRIDGTTPLDADEWPQDPDGRALCFVPRGVWRHAASVVGIATYTAMQYVHVAYSPEGAKLGLVEAHNGFQVYLHGTRDAAHTDLWIPKAVAKVIAALAVGGFMLQQQADGQLVAVGERWWVRWPGEPAPTEWPTPQAVDCLIHEGGTQMALSQKEARVLRAWCREAQDGKRSEPTADGLVMVEATTNDVRLTDLGGRVPPLVVGRLEVDPVEVDPGTKRPRFGVFPGFLQAALAGAPGPSRIRFPASADRYEPILVRSGLGLWMIAQKLGLPARQGGVPDA